MRPIYRHLSRLFLASAAIALVAVVLPGVLTQAQVTEGEWLAEFYANPNLEGDVVYTETVPGPFLDESWDVGETPGPNVPVNEFSVRYTQRVTFDDSNYNFRLTADDGARLYINGALVIDAWEEGEQAQTFFASRVIPVPDGTYTVTVEFYELYGLRQVEVFWDATEDLPASGDENFTIPGNPPNTGGGGDTGGDTGGEDTPGVTVVPGATGPADPTAPYDAWRVRYWDNPNLEGDWVYEETIPTIEDAIILQESWDFAEQPGPEVPVNEFSARFERNIRITAPSNYKFFASADDGARIAINGALVLDIWEEGMQAQDFFEARVIPVPAGTYTIGVEFYELFGERFIDFQAQPTSDLPAQGDENFFIPGGGGDVGTGGGTGGDTGGGTGGGGDVVDTPSGSGILVDQFDEARFIWSGSQQWSVGNTASAVNGSYIFTDNSQVSLRMYGRWNAFFEHSGAYEVYVRVPQHDGAATTNARYLVFANGVLSSPIVVNQEAAEGNWVRLGTFNFASGGSQYVYLNDLTFEDAGTTDVLFDAVEFVPVD